MNTTNPQVVTYVSFDPDGSSSMKMIQKKVGIAIKKYAKFLIGLK